MLSVPLIDIEHIVREKAKGHHLPSFVIRYLKHITHEKEMNTFLCQHADLKDFEFIRAVLSDELHCTFSIKGLEHLNNSQRLVFAGNHPLGGIDGMIVALLLHDCLNQPIRIIVNDFLMHMTPISQLFVPVNKVGEQKRDYVVKQKELWQSDDHILTFPSGACSRQKNGIIRDPEWQISFIRNAVRYQRDIVPFYFEGQNSPFFYLLAQWRKRLRIPWNIEMLYLVDEMYKAKGKHFTIYIGPPVPYQSLDSTRTVQQWRDAIYQTVYSLPKTI